MRRDRGSVLVWTAFVMGLSALVIIWLGQIGAAGTEAARAQSVADVAALAGVDGGREASTVVARRNGASLMSFEDDDGRVTVSVRLGPALAEATATSSDGERAMGAGAS
jgi:uncharacterized membrane protein